MNREGTKVKEDEYKAYAYLALMDDKRISIRARMEGTPGEADEGVIGDMHHIVEEGEEWFGITYEKLYPIAERGDSIDMNKLEELQE